MLPAQGFEQPDIVKDVPACGKEVELDDLYKVSSNPNHHVVLWFNDL